MITLFMNLEHFKAHISTLTDFSKKECGLFKKVHKKENIY